MGEAQEVEGFRFAVPPCRPIGRGMPAEFDQPGLVEKPGARLGQYKLLQQIGEGGMGVVYMAEQEQPVRRRVALKIIKPGMDSAQVLARFEAERQAFGSVARQYARCALMTEHFIGGEYLSRAHSGDPHSGAPLTPVPRAQERRAWQIMNDSLFSDDAWRFSPAMLNRLTYTEWGSFTGAQWAYNPPDRHDMPVVDIVGAWQTQALNTMFQPLVLQRLRDTAVTAKPGQTMSLTDLFDWAQDSVYSDLRSAKLRSIPVIHRNLQQSYARLLLRLVNAPPDNTPYDAQSLARAKLADLNKDIQAAQKRPLDEMTRAHLSDLSHRIAQGLDARQMLTQPRT